MMRHAGRPPGPNDRVLKLPDGRLLGYAEFGEAAGDALFFFHGNPGSRFGGAFLDALAKERGVRVIALERPGFGLSDFQPGRAITDWPADVREAARHLGFERFAVLGYSAGGPYALACAAQLADQIAAVGLVSSADLPKADGAPGRLRSNAEVSLTSLLARRAPGLFFRTVKRGASAEDLRVVSRPAEKRAMLRDVREAFRHGSRGVAEESALVERPWGIDFAAIPSGAKIWHGEQDRIVPVAKARLLASTIPGCIATFMPGAGHFWLLAHAGEALEGLFESRP